MSLSHAPPTAPSARFKALENEKENISWTRAVSRQVRTRELLLNEELGNVDFKTKNKFALPPNKGQIRAGQKGHKKKRCNALEKCKSGDEAMVTIY